MKLVEIVTIREHNDLCRLAMINGNQGAEKAIIKPRATDIEGPSDDEREKIEKVIIERLRGLNVKR